MGIMAPKNITNIGKPLIVEVFEEVGVVVEEVEVVVEEVEVVVEVVSVGKVG